ncbi:MAG: serine protease [Methylococcales bacterium]|nr:serine protease [Methylococcales bacterium]
MLDAQWIVQIYSKDEANDWCIGTGYFINNGLILTAKHNILSGNSISTELKLVFPERDINGIPKKQNNNLVYIFKNGLYFSSQDIICPDNEDIDLAVIRCPEFLNVIPLVQLANYPPPLNEESNTLGFPLAGKVADFQREQLSFPLKRLTETGGDDILILHSSVQLNPTFFPEENGWGGLSGSPVFYKNELVAVIIKTYDTVKSYFYAVSIPWVKEHCPDFCEAIKPPLTEQQTIDQQKQDLHEAIKAGIEKLLKRNFDLDDLVDSVGLSNNAEKNYQSIADCLTKQSTTESIASLIRILQEYQPKKLDDMQEIAGWLMLNSIDSTWWFQNKHKMQQAITEFNLEILEYFETIISRYALQPARYTLECNNTDKSEYDLNKTQKSISDKSKKEESYPKPYTSVYRGRNKEKKEILVLDGNGVAIDEQLLIPIYKDLWGRQHIEDKDIKNSKEDLLRDIKAKAKALLGINQGKLVYYVVNKIYLDLLNKTPWFKDNKQELANYLKFICYEINKSDQQEKPCTEDEKVVLASLDELLKMIE